MSSRRPWACSWRCNPEVSWPSTWRKLLVVRFELSKAQVKPRVSLSTSGSGYSSQPRLQHPFCLCAAMLIPCWWWTKPLKLWACPQLNDFCYKSCRVVTVLEQWLQHSDMVVPLCYSGGGLKTWVLNTQHWLSLCEGSCGVSPGLLLHRGSFSRPEALHDSVLTDSASFPTSCGTSFGVVWMELVPVSFWE